MEPLFKPLPVETIARALSGLPSFRTNDTGALVAARADLARAIASGQDPGQLSTDLSTPGPWLGVDLKKAAGITPPTAATPALENAAKPAAWVTAAAQAAHQSKSALRVAVLDRDPTAVTSLSLPVWAHGQKSVATYGPLLIENKEAQLTFQKWLIIYIVPVQMVSFVRGSTTLFVAPFAATGTAKTINLAGGSVWVNVSPFDSTAPADSFAGVAIQGGTIDSDQNLTLGGTTVTVPSGATLKLKLIPANPGASGNPAIQVAPPADIDFTFPNTGSPTATVAPFMAQIDGQTFNVTPNGQPPVYNDTVKTFAIPCNTDQTQFQPVTQAGSLVTLSGAANLLAAGPGRCRSRRPRRIFWAMRTEPGSLSRIQRGDYRFSGAAWPVRNSKPEGFFSRPRTTFSYGRPRAWRRLSCRSRDSISGMGRSPPRP